MTPLKAARLKEVPPLPTVLKHFSHIETGKPASSTDEIAALFPHLMAFKADGEIQKGPLKVGVVLSGGQALQIGRAHV